MKYLYLLLLFLLIIPSANAEYDCDETGRCINIYYDYDVDREKCDYLYSLIENKSVINQFKCFSGVRYGHDSWKGSFDYRYKILNIYKVNNSTIRSLEFTLYHEYKHSLDRAELGYWKYNAIGRKYKNLYLDNPLEISADKYAREKVY